MMAASTGLKVADKKTEERTPAASLNLSEPTLSGSSNKSLRLWQLPR